MHLPTILLTLLPTLTLSTLIFPRQLLATGQTVKEDVINIHNAVLALDSTIQSFQGSPIPTSLIEGTPVLFGVAEIHKVNRAGFCNALLATPFTVEDSRDVVDTVVDTVNVSIPTSIERLKAKAPAFKEGGLTVTVIASLKLLLYDHDTFSAATIAKLNLGVGAEKIEEGSDAVANIHNAIQGGIEFFAADSV
ncbi:hydrophobic surface binding protein A-domain-containing protein [Ampelomyces quisqualis]|uniref:Hydrophobic surface binding protein A-domain-containing protein n=1 Tax=Ampelomyces quisqualis TaxID=50730 RepID=A0A6A5QF12_AMPQU|nr:hydrophobic surface binding protein A-domain-containing protein [Ampelomyces quisqualis]